MSEKNDYLITCDRAELEGFLSQSYARLIALNSSLIPTLDIMDELNCLLGIHTKLKRRYLQDEKDARKRDKQRIRPD